MAVSIVPKFKREDIVKALKIKKQQIEDAVLLRLIRVGEQFVTNARNKADFTDRTGNLRSSIGYVIIKNGVQLKENFKQTAGGPDGIENAEKAIANAAAKYPSGLVLIGVAGMDYAAAVESRGFDVITTSAGIAATSLKEAMAKLASKLK